MRRLILAALLLATPATAQEVKTPYWASIRPDEVNMRVGPGEDYRIAWVYRRKGLPLKVLRLKEGWRLVQDPDGAQGWMHQRFLTRERMVYVKAKAPTPMREEATDGAKLLWKLAPGVVAKLGECDAGWCEVSLGQRKGYVAQAQLFGAGEP